MFHSLSSQGSGTSGKQKKQHHNGDKKEKSQHNRKKVTLPELSGSCGENRDVPLPKNLKVTLENIIATIPDEPLDRDSVVEMVKCIYTYFQVDPNVQIRLPSPAGSRTIRKMWPHGSTVDTRKSTKANKGDKSVVLEDLGDETASVISGSAVSDTRLDDREKHTPSNIIYTVPEEGSSIQYTALHQPTYSTQHSFYNSTASGAGGYPPPLNINRTVPRVLQQDTSTRRGIPRGVQRFSLMGPANGPPEVVHDTPESQPVRPARVPEHTPTRTPRKVRVGTASRSQGVNDSVSVQFEDDP